MFSYLIYSISLTAIYEFTHVLSEECSVVEMHKCIMTLHNYAEQTFPLYGRNETELDRTCRGIQKAMECLNNFDSCTTDSNCDQSCQKGVQMINVAKRTSDLPDLFLQLCQGRTSFKINYLEHATCLDEASSLYEECYNTKKLSYIQMYNNRRITPENVCCIESSAVGCYIQNTRERCGTDAALFVEEGFNILKAVLNRECVPYRKCEKPPFPVQQLPPLLGKIHPFQFTGSHEEIPGSTSTLVGSGNTMNESSEFTSASSEECTKEEANKCLTMLYEYGDKTFLRYGRNETELDRTCQEIQKTKECLYNMDSCGTGPKCNEECQKVVQSTNVLKKGFDIPDLFLQLCQGRTSFKTNYLEHATCLDEASPLYEECYNSKNLAFIHMYKNPTLQTPENICCVDSLAVGCYIQKTRERCGTDAAVFVEQGFNILKAPQILRCIPYKKCHNLPFPIQEITASNEETPGSANTLVRSGNTMNESSSTDPDNKFTHSSSEECSAAEIRKCLEKFHKYEEETFPRYGRNETELDQTCRDMQKATECPYNFVSCTTDPNCDKECQEGAQMTDIIKEHSNLPHLFLQLCQGRTSFKINYLKHATCLHGASPFYEECYNTTMLSLIFIFNNNHLLTAENKCCVYSWSLGCYIQKTRERCGTDAALFVEEAFNILKALEHVKCVRYKKCENPPFPVQEAAVSNEETPGSTSALVVSEITMTVSSATDPDNSGSLQPLSFGPTSLLFLIAFVALLSEN